MANIAAFSTTGAYATSTFVTRTLARPTTYQNYATNLLPSVTPGGVTLPTEGQLFPRLY
jgi:hypothetical protein